MTMLPFIPKPSFSYKGFLHSNHKKRERKSDTNSKFQGKCHLRVRKRETPSRATDYALARASVTVGWTKKKVHKAIRIVEKGFYYFLGNVGVLVE